jgi:hypothetical protein
VININTFSDNSQLISVLIPSPLYYEKQINYLLSLEITQLFNLLNFRIMKKIVLAFTAIMSILMVSTAQVPISTKQAVSFSIMPKAGVSFSTVRMGLSNYKDKKMQGGLIAGVAFPIGFGDWFEVQPEFNYIQKNSKFTYTSDDGATSLVTTQKLQQFEIPVLLKARFDGFYVAAGPSVSFNTKGHSEINDVKTDFTFGSGTTELKKSLWGLQFGAGYNFDAGVGKINLDARYGLGLTDLDNVTGDKNTSRSDGFAVSVGYLIPMNY